MGLWSAWLSWSHFLFEGTRRSPLVQSAAVLVGDVQATVGGTPSPVWIYSVDAMPDGTRAYGGLKNGTGVDHARCSVVVHRPRVMMWFLSLFFFTPFSPFRLRFLCPEK